MLLMMKFHRPVCLLFGLFLLLPSCGQNRDAMLRQAVTFAYGDWSPADVGRLLAEGAAVNAVGEDGLPPLLCAYGIGQDMFEDDPQHEAAVESIHLLLKAGADVQARTPAGHNALDLALCRYNNEPVVRLLRELGLKATNPEYELVWHALHNHAEQVRRLLAEGVSPNAHSVDGCSALWAAMPWFNLKPHSAECMELLLAAGAEVNELRDGHSLMDMTMIFCGDEMEYRYRDLLQQHGAVYVNPPCRH